MRMNDFHTDLDYAHEMEDAPWWDVVYRKAFGPRLLTHTRHPQNGWHQAAGVDRLLIFTNGETAKVDEKVRRKSRPDILLELYSSYYGSGSSRNTQGWATKDTAADYIAYALAPAAVCYLLPVPLLRSALRENWQDWLSLAATSQQGFRFVDAQNRTYVTRNIAVPTPTLLDAMGRAMTVTWSTAAPNREETQ